MQNVVISVRGGMVTAVYCNETKINVVVVDWDSDSIDSADIIPCQTKTELLKNLSSDIPRKSIKPLLI